jgi:hypothetical protein
MMCGAAIISVEKLSDTRYKLVAGNGQSYLYECVDSYEEFQTQNEEWKATILKSQEILMKWIQNPTSTCPACIYWNFEGKALLVIKMGNPNTLSHNEQVFEINPFGLIHTNEWVNDSACPFPIGS